MFSLLNRPSFLCRSLFSCLTILCFAPGWVVADEADVQFNTDVLDVKDRANIDLGEFPGQAM